MQQAVPELDTLLALLLLVVLVQACAHVLLALLEKLLGLVKQLQGRLAVTSQEALQPSVSACQQGNFTSASN